MSFQVKIKNIGKLADADIRIGDLTVFAGPNNTGKSFVSKLLYSLFNAMNADPVKGYMNNSMKPVRILLRRLIRRIPIEDDSLSSLFEEMNKEFEKLRNLIKEYSTDEFEELGKIILDCLEKTNRMEKISKDIISLLKANENDIENKYNPVPPAHSRLVRSSKQIAENIERRRVIMFLEDLIRSLSKLNNTFESGSEQIFHDSMRWKIEQSLIQNFQVSKLPHLQDVESTSSEVEIEGFGNFKIVNDKPQFRITLAQTYANLIYLESPFYWKLKNALENIRDYPSFRRPGDRERLSGVPEYFYDLARALKFQYTGDMAFPHIYERLTGKDVMGGKMALSETGDLLFHENGRQFPMSLTATGVANLGILALLIERKVLDKGAFLFIDEPEAHLHPAWQVIMAEALFDIAKQGAKVVIATHSPDILKWLEVHAKENPEDKKLIALNHFTYQGIRDSEQDFEVKMAMIKKSLTEPFSNLYLKGLTL